MDRCVFLDRDGVINEKPATGEYIRNWNDFRFLPGIKDWIRLFNALDYRVIVVTNQRGVARGLVREEDVAGIHANMIAELEREGAHVDDLLCCIHNEDSCFCRKPKPGMVLQAQSKWGIDLPNSIMIGDSECDRQLAAACGMRFVCVSQGHVVDDTLARLMVEP